jgi:UDP-glucose:(heptosyl)LPS alpha-1,3-glucosyltransferase
MSMSRLKQRLNPLHRVLLKLERLHFADRQYRRIIATTEVVRRDLNHHYQVPKEDVVIIPNGFSPQEFSPGVRRSRRESTRAAFKIEPKEKVLLFVANELERKGLPTVLRALKILDRSDLRLFVVGRASPRTVNRLAQKAGVSSKVTAFPSSDDVALFHAAADLFVLPTQYEAFCLAILEALGSGVPVITTRVPGAQDAINDRRNGVLVDDPLNADELASAIQWMLADDHLANCSAAAPSSVTQFQWPVVLKKYEAVLRECAR